MLEQIPGYMTIITVGATCSAAVYSAVEVVKPLLKRWRGAFWHTSLLRALALASGAGFGTALFNAIGDNSGWPWGTIIGAGAGGLCAVVVAALKRKLKAVE
jgi:hypothetical protein